MKDIKNQVEQIVKNIEQGIEVTKDDLFYDSFYEVGDMLSGFDYLTDVLDIQYILNSNREFIGARLLVAFGGPNIWIDTLKQQVEGYWWGDSFTLSYSEDAMDLNECLNQLFNC